METKNPKFPENLKHSAQNIEYQKKATDNDAYYNAICSSYEENIVVMQLVPVHRISIP